MHRLKGRLRKLESRVDTGPSWNDYFVQAERLARALLSSSDCDLLEDSIAIRKERARHVWTEAQRSVWHRWRAAFDKAVVELKIPYSMHVDDAWL